MKNLKTKNNIVDTYINDVLTGKIKSCEYVKLAVRRYIDDIQSGSERGIYLDEKAGNHAVKFFTFLKHTKGEFAGKPFNLSPWEIFIVWNVFGWKRADGTRRFNYAYVEVPRKNGKSTLCAGIALYLLDADGEAASEVYCFATKEDQAKKTIFKEAKNMVLKSPMLNKRLECYTKSIFSEITLSFFQPLGSDSDTQDGLNTHGGINDEYHAHRDDSMFNVIKSSMGSRLNPLMFTITTAGVNINGACYTERETCIKILQGILHQDNKFAIIYTIDEGDSWEDENNWVKANPNWGVSLRPQYIRDEYLDAKNNPTRVNNFKTKHLDIWCKSTESFISDEDWMKCDFSPLDFEKIKGKKCYAGLDIAKRIDLNAFVLFCPDTNPYTVYPFFWIPESKVEQNRDKVNYEYWGEQKFIKIVPGDVIDMDSVANDILEIIKQVDIQSYEVENEKVFHIGCDPAYSELGIAKKLNDAGIKMSAFRQGFISMGPPTGELEALVKSKMFNHGGHPVLRWNISNTVIVRDDAGNMKSSKAKSIEKIDGTVALVMAIGEWMTSKGGIDINEFYKTRNL